MGVCSQDSAALRAHRFGGGAASSRRDLPGWTRTRGAGRRRGHAPYQIEHIRDRVAEAVELYNGRAGERDRIDRVSLFDSYAEGRASASSDVDLLVAFSSPAVSLISLARALEAMEDSLGVPVDLVQEPLPQGSLLTIGKAVPLYGAA